MPAGGGQLYLGGTEYLHASHILISNIDPHIRRFCSMCPRLFEILFKVHCLFLLKNNAQLLGN